MKFDIYCLPCILRMSIDTVIMCAGDENLVRKLFETLRGFTVEKTSPELVYECQSVIREVTGCHDPYKEIKARDIHSSEIVSKIIAEMIKNGDIQEDLKTSLLISAIGNTLDAGISLSDQLDGRIQQEITKSFAIYEGDRLEALEHTAQSVLIIGDNIGEFALDRFLFKRFQNAIVTYAVRSEPILNDLSVDDIKQLDYENVRFISSGCSIPGTILTTCSDAFLKEFYNSDVVIAKGLGNYETLESERDVFYLFKVKCDIIAKNLGIGIGEYVLTRKSSNTVQ